MPENKKQTSAQIAKLASEVLQNDGSSRTAKRLAASASSQRSANRQTGADMEDAASKALVDKRSSQVTKKLAGTVLSQSNKKR